MKIHKYTVFIISPLTAQQYRPQELKYLIFDHLCMVPSFNKCLLGLPMGLGYKVYIIGPDFLSNPYADCKEKPIILKICYTMVGAMTDRYVKCLRNPEEEGRTFMLLGSLHTTVVIKWLYHLKGF